MSSFTELHGYNLKDLSLFWDYPTFLELKCLFLYKMIGNGRLVAVHVSFLKLKLNLLGQRKTENPMSHSKLLQTVLTYKTPKLGKDKLRSL